MAGAIHTVISETLGHLQAQVTAVLPRVMAALLIVSVGALAGWVIGRATNWVLGARHLDRTVARLGLARSLETIGVRSSVRTLSTAARWLVILLASVMALGVLDGRLAGELMRRLILYLPELAVALVILAAGWILAGHLSRAVLIAAVNNEVRSARRLGTVTRILVMMVTLAVACEEAGIGRTTMLVAFGILFGAVALAAALAVGFGAQDVVRQWISQRLDKPVPEEKWARLRHW